MWIWNFIVRTAIGNKENEVISMKIIIVYV